MAAKGTIGPKIVIDGEKEFKQAITNINAALKENASAMTLATAKYADNSKSVDALKAKQEVLQKSFSDQTQKVDTLRKAVENATKQYGENDKKTVEWRTSLNKAEAALANLDRELKTNDADLKKAQSSMKDMDDATGKLNGKAVGLGDALNTVGGKLGISLPQNVTDSLNSFATFDAKLLGTVAIMAGVAAAVYKIEDALIDLTLAQAAATDKMLEQSSVSGIGAEALQEYQYMAGLIDTPIETITGSLTKMVRSMNDARKGTGDAADAFKTLRVRVTDSHGQLRDQNDVFDEVIDKLGKMKNETERDALSMQIFGRSARDLNPMIEAGSDAINGFREEARKMGYGLDEVERKSLANVDDALQRFNAQITTTSQDAAVKFAPAMETLLSAGQGVFEGLSAFMEDSGLVEVFASVLEIVASLGPAFETAGKIVGPLIGTILKPLALALAVVADALTVVVSMIALLVEGVKYLFNLGNPEALNRSMSTMNRYALNIERVFSSQGATATTFANLYGDKVKKYALGTSYHTGGPALVGENGPELIWPARGASVTSSKKTMQLLAASGGMQVGTLNIYPNAAQWAQLMNLVSQSQNARQNARAGR